DRPVVLTAGQRDIVSNVIVRHCHLRNWPLHAHNVRSNHVHVVVSAEIEPKNIREQLKAWASRRLSEDAGLRGFGKDGLRRWWTEKGDIEWVYDDNHLARVIDYVMEMQ